MSFLPLHLGFHVDFLHRHSDSPHFFHFDADFPHPHADSPHPHSHPIPRIPRLILRISLILFPDFPFWILQIACSVCNFLRIYFRKIVALVQKRTLPFVMTSSVLSPKIIYLIYLFIYWHYFKSIQWKIIKNNYSKSTPSPLYIVTNHKSSNSIKYIYKDLFYSIFNLFNVDN